MKNTVLLVAMLLAPISTLWSQYNTDQDRWMLGLSVGINGALHEFNKPFSGSQISYIPQTVIPEKFLQETYNVKEVHQTGFVAGFFGEYRSSNEILSLYTDLMLSKHTSGYDYGETNGQLTYEMRFNSLLASLTIGPKISYRGLYVRLGVQTGTNLASKHVLYSHEPVEIYGDPKNVEDELNALFQVKGQFGFIWGLGYELELDNLSFILDARHCIGTSDPVTVSDNTYGFRNLETNRLRTIQITAGIGLHLN